MNNIETTTNSLLKPSEVLNLFDNMQTINNNFVIKDFVDIGFPPNGELKSNEICFYRINQLSFDEDYPHREAFENILLSLDSEAFNFVYILTGTEIGIELCLGVVQNHNKNTAIQGERLSANNYGEIIASTFEGNFNGSKLEKITGNALTNLITTSSQKYKNAGMITGIPSINEKETGNEYDFQGIDRLINSMLGLEWRLVIICEPVSKDELYRNRNQLYSLYNRLSMYEKVSMQHSENKGESASRGFDISDSKATNWNHQITKSNSQGSSDGGRSYQTTTNHTNQNSKSQGGSKDHSEGVNYSYSKNEGFSSSFTMELSNMHASSIMQYIEDELLERLRLGISKGMFKTSLLYMADNPVHANRLKAGIMSIFQGNKSSYSPLHAQKIDLNNNQNILSAYQNQYIRSSAYTQDSLLLLCRPFNEQNIGISTYLTPREISLVAGLPQKEIPGIVLKESVDFGLNEKPINDNNTITLGCMVQKGRKLNNIKFNLDKKSLTKHIFIAGVTGGGKTTTCHKLLAEAKTPFLVIEPAKTEYRCLIDESMTKFFENITVFTLGNETVAPFRINPFELVKGEIISAHIDMVKATFISAFPMEAAMPQILEEAIYSCYEKKGWNIDTNTNEIYGDKAFDTNVNSFPIMSDLVAEISGIVKSKKFSDRLASDYVGSLVSRISNLTIGSKGAMLNCEHSIDFQNYILHNNVILEMEELKSPEDKALLMGFVLGRLSTVIKMEYLNNSNYKHLTLIEEAHRLLTKTSPGDSGSKKSAIETFTDLLAEIRTYGECLIVVDQIPNKLAPEVLKNTNTKIIHKIFARDDKDAVGDTMLMDDKQKEYLSALEVGNAIVFTEQTSKPVHVYINAISNTGDNPKIRDSDVKKHFDKNIDTFGDCYKYIDIIHQLYKPIVKLCRQLEKTNGLNVEKFDKDNYLYIKELISDFSIKHKLNEYDIWKTLISRKNSLSGNNNEQNNLILTDFFVNEFTGDIIKTSDTIKKLNSYF